MDDCTGRIGRNATSIRIDYESKPFHHSKQQEYCPQCGAPLQIKQGKKGLFLGCSAYPECDYLRPLQRAEHKVLKTLDEICPKCGNLLQLKQVVLGCLLVVAIILNAILLCGKNLNLRKKLLVLNVKWGILISRRGRQRKNFLRL